MNTETSSNRPPSFEEATNRRQKARIAGLDPDYWYPVEKDSAIAPGQVIEVKFWKRSIALYRDQVGCVHAVENRCAHRQLKLSAGSVQGDCLVCPYHGWRYDGTGKLVAIDHDLFGNEMPRIRIRSFPLQVRYGLIWIFPGNPALAAERTMPNIPEIEGPVAKRWAWQLIDFSWRAHHSMIVENVCDFSHAYVHRKYAPFSQDSRLTHCEVEGDSVRLGYDTKVGRGRISSLFIDHDGIGTNAMELGYDYPYQWSNTGDRIKNWMFPLPVDENHTRGFFIFAFDTFKMPFLPVRIPRKWMTVVLRAANELHIKPLLRQDGIVVELEQEGYEKHYDAPHTELNPVVHAFQQLNVRKWEEHLLRQSTGNALAGTGSCAPVRKSPKLLDLNDLVRP